MRAWREINWCEPPHDMIHVIPSIDPTSTCLHAENPHATAMVLKWRTFQKLILLPGPEKNLRAAAKKSATLVIIIIIII